MGSSADGIHRGRVVHQHSRLPRHRVDLHVPVDLIDKERLQFDNPGVGRLFGCFFNGSSSRTLAIVQCKGSETEANLFERQLRADVRQRRGDGEQVLLVEAGRC